MQNDTTAQDAQPLQASQPLQDAQGMQDDGRRANGTFAPGNKHGRGRPARPIEATYLAALADTLTLDRWRAIVERAIADAEGGDKAAREWVARYCLGASPATLLDLARRELAGATDTDEIEAAGKLAEANASIMGTLTREALGFATTNEGAIVLAAAREARQTRRFLRDRGQADSG